jgi:uncharacterized membrane protein YkvA (DUF1232 family)
LARWLERWRRRARDLRRDVYALYLACRDPRVPWYAKAFATGLVAYALSPIDLIPDFIPVLGYVDELILLPVGVLLAMKMIPADVLAECRERARLAAERPVSRVGAVLIIAVWLVAASLAVLLALRLAGANVSEPMTESMPRLFG